MLPLLPVAGVALPTARAGKEAQLNRSPARWQHIASLYELAVDRDEAMREAFLAEACAGDEDLRCEVESLLRQDVSGVLLDRSLWATAASLLDDGCEIGPGTPLGPYRIESALGSGGMGEVFRAVDTRLDRTVAIKVLPTGDTGDEQMRARFAREARAIAALTHPHICTLYDVGRHDQVDFLVMEYLEGDTLAERLAAERLPVQDALVCAIQIAGALDHAHGHGIVHRDLKPANVMLTAGGAKLLDFGLAKFRPIAGASLPEPVMTPGRASPAVGHGAAGRLEGNDGRLTEDGTIPGTVRYMAPEQIAGVDVDARCDLFSFGAVVFEMLTGRRAFDGDSAVTVRAAVLGHEPPAVSSLQPLAPPALDPIVRRCLTKDPKDRWQTASDVIRALQHAAGPIGEVPAPRRTDESKPGGTRRWVRGGLVAALVGLAVSVVPGERQRWWDAVPPGRIQSIAVLPLDNLSGDADQEYFADGMTEQLITDLARVHGLRVISRASVMHYKTAPKPLPAVARELQVDAIIEGTVTGADGQVRVNARLVTGPTGEVVWAQSFERDLRDVLDLQRELAERITSLVGVRLTPGERVRLARARPIDPDVHRQVLLARHHAAKATEDGLRKALHYFEAAIARDPLNAPAHAGLAEAYTELAGFYIDPRDAMPKAKQAAETAIRLDDTIADAHAALGYVRLVYDWDGPGAAKALLRALDLNPTLATARLNYAAYLTTQARDDDAVREIRRAVDLDPLSVRTHAFGTVLLLFTRRYEEAIELARRGLEFEPNASFTLAFQGVAYAEQGRFNEAVENLQRAAQLDNSLTILALQAHVLAVAGRTQEARELIQRVEEAARHQYFCPYEIGTVYVSLGDLDTAHRLFRKGTDEHADCMAWLGVEPWLDAFRGDPRYGGLVREIGLYPHTP
jgi:eukaryotic-like serine/threonine-protein kinase